jgi:hypothetical protein
MELTTLFERGVEIRQAAGNPNQVIKQRIAAAAAELSNAGNNQARVDLLQEAALSVTKLCYECDPDGTPCNIDARTYRLLVPAPWGKAGWRKWGLRDWEAGIMRQILIVRGQMQRVPPLFDYNAESRTWHVNMQDYGRLDLGLVYWKQNPIQLKDWRLYADVYRQKAHERTLRNQNSG